MDLKKIFHGKARRCSTRHVSCFCCIQMEQVIKCAVPLLGGRVAPRFMFSSSVLVAVINDQVVSEPKTISTEKLDEYQRVDLLLDLEVDVLVCGGIDQGIVKLFGDYGIQVICNVAGEAEEVIEVLAEGALRPWHGYGRQNGGSDLNNSG